MDEPSLVFSDGQWYSFNDGEWYALEGGEWQIVSEAHASALDSAQSSSLSADASGFDSEWYADGPYYEVTLYSTDGVDWYSLEGDAMVAWEPTEVIDDRTLWSPSASLGESGIHGVPAVEAGS